MKIGQVTMFNYNYGSVLQCFATQQIFGYYGYECVLLKKKENNMFFYKINYALKILMKMLEYPKYYKEFLSLIKAQSKSELSSLTEYDLKCIKDFIDHEINSDELTYGELIQCAKSHDYRMFISGSDQIWNGNWFLRNKMFFLKFAPKEKRAAWAPSFGCDKIAEYNVRRFKRDIKEYNFLSAREESGVKIINELTGREATEIIDPVFLVDSVNWKGCYMKKYSIVKFENYVFCYFLNEPNEIVIDYLTKCSNEGKIIIAFASRYDSISKIKNIFFKGGSPWYFLALIDNANEICTDSFHGLAFSLIFHKKVKVFKRNYSHGKDQSERIKALLNKICYPEIFTEDNANINTEVVVDYSKVDFIIYREQLRAENYINTILLGK